MDIEARQRGLVASGRAAAQAFQASLARPEPVTTPVVECIESATVCPENHAFRNDAGVLVQDGGVYYPDGRLCELSVHRACNRLHANVPLPLASSVASREVTGTHLFGGILIGHFGHFLLESLSRLWALDEMAPKSKVSFSSKAGGCTTSDPPLRGTCCCMFETPWHFWAYQRLWWCMGCPFALSG